MPHVLIYGSDHLAFRVAEQLCAEGCMVSVIAAPNSWLANAGLTGAGLAGVAGSLATVAFFCDQRTEVALLQAAEIEQMETLFAVTDRDEANLGMTLAALELNPRLHVVLRQFNVRLGTLLEQYLPQCDVMSMSMLAASTFALAACSPGVRFAHHLGADTLVLREVTSNSLQTSASFNRENSRIVVVIDEKTVNWFPPPDRVFGPNARVLIASTERELPAYPRLSRQGAGGTPRLSW